MDAAAVLRDASAILAVPDQVMCAAKQLQHRSRGQHGVAACLVLASKMCEAQRRTRDVINAVHLAQTGELLRSTHEYWALKEALVLAEQNLLRALAFDAECDDRQVLLLNSLRLFRAPLVQYKLSVALLNDCTGIAACERYAARVLVAAAMALSAEMLELQVLPDRWLDILEVSSNSLTGACHAMLDAYSQTSRTKARSLPAESALGGEGQVETRPAQSTVG